MAHFIAQRKGFKFKASMVAVVVFVLVAVATAAILLFPMLFLAGPHSDILPAWGATLTLLSSWLSVVLIPLYLSIRVYRWYLNRNRSI
jgi:hypothetical protein